MKKRLGALLVALALAGCASKFGPFYTARANANRVTNGMTVAQAVEILGTPPSYIGNDAVWWRGGNAQRYDGKASGAIRYKLKDGVIVGVPPDGVFSLAAEQAYSAEPAVERTAAAAAKAASDAEAAKLTAEKQRIAERDAAEARMKAERAAAERKVEIAAEAEAAANSSVTCHDKIMCAKVFALAQIYVTERADQKIQVATDTVIETYNPTELGRVGIKLIKMPRNGSNEIISLTASCKVDEYNERSCRLKRTEIYRGFRPFIESNLAK
jgi:hypothetical protein